MRDLERRFAMALGSLRVGDVVALTIAREHLGDDFRRILQIGVHDHDGVAGCVIQARGERRRVAEVPREVDELDPVIPGGPFRQQRGRAVATAVVHDDPFHVAR